MFKMIRTWMQARRLRKMRAELVAIVLRTKNGDDAWAVISAVQMLTDFIETGKSV